MATYTTQQQKIIQDAQSSLGFNQLSPEAAYYRQYGKFQTPTQTAPTTQPTSFLQPAQPTPTYQQPTQTPTQTTQPTTQLFQPISTQPTTQTSTNTGQTGYYKDAQNNVYTSSGQHVTLDQFKAAGLNIDHIPLQGGTATKSPELNAQDYLSYYESTIGNKVQQAEQGLAETKAQEQELFKTSQDTISGLYKQSDDLFNQLFKGSDITKLRTQSQEAFTKLADVDVRQKQEEQALREQIKERGTLGYFGNQALRSVQMRFDGERAQIGAEVAIANQNYDMAMEQSQLAYNHFQNNLKNKVELVDRELKRAANLSSETKAEYQEILAEAKSLIKERETNKDEALDLFLSLSTKGVKGLSPTMSLAHMAQISSPELVRQAQEDRALAIKASKKSGDGGLTQAQYLTQIGRISDDVRVDPDVKDFVSIRDGYDRVQTGANLNNAQGDLALLFGYMKLLDPQSVVRETEFANAEAAMGYAQRILNMPAKALKGNRLTPEARQDFAQAADALYKAKQANYQNAIDFYKNQAETIGLDPNLVLRKFEVEGVQPTENVEQQIVTEINQFKDQYRSREEMLADLYQGYPGVSKDIVNRLLYNTWSDK